MRVGVAREIKTDEFRVALTPAGVRDLTAAGHEVFVEESAGVGSGFTDDAYLRAGGVLADVDLVWERAELLLKVKEPVAQEYARINEGQVLFTYLHLAADAPLTAALVQSGATCIAYETVQRDNGFLPLLAPMSEVAGRLAPQAAAQTLESPRGGPGVLLAGVPGVPPARVVVLGGGIVGFNAAKMAIGLGAEVWITETSIDRIRELDSLLGGRATVVMSTHELVEDLAASADVVIGAVLVTGARAPRLITREMLGSMKDGAVVVDVAIDQGGCFETSHPTTHSDPTFIVDDVIHYCVANMPGAVPRTSTRALTNSTLPFIKLLAGNGLLSALESSRELTRGVNVHGHHVTNAAVAASLGLEFASLDLLVKPAA